MLVKIYFSNGISEHRIDSKIPQSIQIKFDSVPKKVLVEKITINDIEANIYQNTVFHIANSTEKLTSAHSFDNPGTYELKIDNFYLQCLRSGNWHLAQNDGDYIFKYEFIQDSFDNTFIDRDHIGFQQSFIPCFGCSFTYGAEQKKSQSWPNLLSKKTGKNYLNLGVEGAGIDIIANNLIKLYQQHPFKKCVLLVPSFARKIVKCNVDNFLLQVPSTVELPTNNFSYLSRLTTESEKIRKEIYQDVNDTYSKNQLEKIFKFCQEHSITVHATSWMANVNEFLNKNYAKYKLPDFAPLDIFEERADDGMHPHEKHYQYFVDSIVDFL